MTAYDGVRAAYDTVAETYADHLPDTRAESPLDLAVLDAFAAGVAAAADPRVLDAGCGTGRISAYLTARGCRVEGLDLSPGMVARARRDHPDLAFAVGSLDDLPYADATFAGVALWYSTIHTLPRDQRRVLSEAARVLRPGGHLVVAFQAGEGTRDVAPSYARFGLEVSLERHLRTADEVAADLAAVGLTETCRMLRRAQGAERDDQAVLLAVRSEAPRVQDPEARPGPQPR